MAEELIACGVVLGIYLAENVLYFKWRMKHDAEAKDGSNSDS